MKTESDFKIIAIFEAIYAYRWPTILLMFLLPAAVQAQFNLQTNNGAITITAYTGSASFVTIPDTTNGYPVTTIGAAAFDNSFQVTKVIIGTNVTSLGFDAFSGCNSMTNVNIPNNVTNIGSASFFACYKLPNIAIGDGVIVIGTDAFQNCIALKNVTIGTNVISLGDDSFAGCSSLVSATIPNSAKIIGFQAFNGCVAVTNITIGSGVTNIGAQAFTVCTSLTAINVNGFNSSFSSVAGVLFNLSQNILIAFPGGQTGNYVVPNTVTTIGDGSFAVCTLSGVTIPNSVTNIGTEAFTRCPNLTNVTMGNNVTNIGTEAFAQCPKLASIVIPASVASIAAEAFYDCASLTGVYFRGDAPSFGDSIFFDDDDNDPAVFYLPGTTGWSDFSDLTGYPSFLWNPQAQTDDGSFGVQNNQFGFNITGSSNLVIVVEANTNLSNPAWTPVGTNTLNTFIGTNGQSYFSDPQWTNYPNRFYRLRSP